MTMRIIVHYRAWKTATIYACGVRRATHSTGLVKQVTCKRCKRWLRKHPP